MEILSILPSVSVFGITFGTLLMGLAGPPGREEKAPRKTAPNPAGTVQRSTPLDIGTWRSSEDSLSQAAALFIISPLSEDHADPGNSSGQ